MKRKKKNFINQAIYPGGLKAMRTFIQNNLVYPKAALQKKIEGKVFIKYVVGRNGNVIESKVIHGLGYGCDEEAIRLVQSFKFDVKETRGLKIKHNKSIKIHFRLAQAYLNKRKDHPIQQIAYTTIRKDEGVAGSSNKSRTIDYEIKL